MFKPPRPIIPPKRKSYKEILDILSGIENTREEFKNALDQVTRTEAHCRLNNLYVCLPVTDIIERLTESGTKLKGAA